MANLIETNSRIKPILTGINTSKSWYLCSNTGDEGVNDEMIKYFGDAINTVNLQKGTLEEAAVPLRNGINQLISKYKITK